MSFPTHTALVGFAIVTLVFHFGSQNINAKEWYRNRDASKLPKLDANWQKTPYSTSVFNIIFSLFFMAWLAGWTQPIIDFNKGTFQTLQPEHLTLEISNYFIWFYFLLIVGILNSINNLVHPHWRVSSLLITVFSSLAVGIVLFSISFIPDIIDWSSLVSLHTGEAPKLAAHLSDLTTAVVRIAALISIYEFGKSIYRLVVLQKIIFTFVGAPL